MGPKNATRNPANVMDAEKTLIKEFQPLCIP